MALWYSKFNWWNRVIFWGQNNEFLRISKRYKDEKSSERNIEIIGEAVNRILKEKPDFKIENSRNIVGTRNRIIHSYDNIADDMIWSILINSLPKLKVEIKTLLD